MPAIGCGRQHDEAGIAGPVNGSFSTLRAYWKGRIAELAKLFGSEGTASQWLDSVLFRDELKQLRGAPGVISVATEYYDDGDPLVPVFEDRWQKVSPDGGVRRVDMSEVPANGATIVFGADESSDVPDAWVRIAQWPR